MDILIISGSTATGKTSIGIHLADIFNGELISADSRQVFKGMDIVTGKDHPEGAIIHGLDLVDPDQDFDVSAFISHATEKIKDISSRGKLPIIVGGTGFYINALLNSPETIGIPINKKLRTELEKLSVNELQTKLKSSDPEKLSKMNNSDINNPRRLIRAIEISKSKQKQINPTLRYNYLHLNLTTSIDHIEKKIRDRVEKRISLGAIEETKKLLEKYDASLSSMSSLGYQEIIQYLNHQISKEELVNIWTLHEFQYAKRQITWFNKQDNLTTISIQDKNYIDISTESVRKWIHNNQSSE